MGAIYICPRNIVIPNGVLNVFTKKGFSKPRQSYLGDIQVLLYKKQHFNSINQIHHGESSLFIIGTCFYQNFDYVNGLHQILDEYIAGILDITKTIGSFFLLLWHRNNLKFLTDGAGIQNVYYHRQSGIISSSFLACIVGATSFSGKLKLNRLALTETLITGNLIGPDTLVEGINRFEYKLDSNILGIPTINTEKYSSKYNYYMYEDADFNSEINKQIDTLKEYFSSITHVIEELGVSTGLTGGFDSRLLLILLKGYCDNYQVYSTSREILTNEYICARNMSNAICKDIISPPHRPPNKITSDELLRLLSNNMYYNDGMIRTHQLWTEEIKGKEYLKKLLGKYKIDITGVGGEQYRNHAYILKNEYPFLKWVYYELVYRNIGNTFSHSDYKWEVTKYIQSKIANLLGIDKSATRISHLNIKRYYNEIYNPANRTIRNNIENQLAFILSPFTDQRVSSRAYHAIPFLGWHHNFEKEMIDRISPELSDIKTDYGYAIDEQVPLKYAVIPLMKNMLGLSIYNKLYYKSKKHSNSSAAEFTRKHPFLNKYISFIELLKLPLHISKIKRSDYLFPLLLESGYFLIEMEEYVDCN
jgi:hypothetical protein